ncbi:nicotinamide riboside transporter PnuC [Sphingobium boeckii]|uniref:Nicotinamide riboside transporter PnuC n=1 Tax=Sphingobium boeckii TaxID=1082345 RepID=A0A7W9EDU5_9SPHN|nr:nicotinamide mononucleotide transporter [Sphingobium boeckii]
MSGLEIIAVILGAINIVLIVRRNIWNYPVGMAMVTLYAQIFFDAKLYSDALLQIFFFIVQIYGWWYWLRGRAQVGDIVVEALSWRARGLGVAGLILATASWGWMMHRYTDAHFPWWDGGIAMMSVAAQLLMSRRYLENWLLWIGVDIMSVGLYWVKDLKLTSALYVVFLALSIWGFEEWMRVRQQKAVSA